MARKPRPEPAPDEALNIAIQRLRGDDLVHQKQLREFLTHEADAFHTVIAADAPIKLLNAVKDKKVNVLFVFAAGEIAGFAVQFPAAIPRWNAASDRFDILPVLYSEDMGILPGNRKGTGTQGMKLRVEQAASKGKEGGLEHDGKDIAGALVGEEGYYKEHAMGSLLKKFGAVQEENRNAPVLKLDTMPHKKDADDNDLEVYSLWRQNANGGLDGNMVKRSDFSIYWPTVKGAKIAATFSLGMSTFNGHPVVRVHIAGSDSLTDEPGLADGIKKVLERGMQEVRKKNWMENESVDPYERTFVHALGEPIIHQKLKQVGATDRILGDVPTYPLTMYFDEIPSAMNVKLSRRSALIPISDSFLEKVAEASMPSAPPPEGNGTRTHRPRDFAAH